MQADNAGREPDVPGAVQVGFDFSGNIEEGTSIHEAKLSTVGDKTRVTLYVAGGHDLFAAPLDVGSITLAGEVCRVLRAGTGE